MAWDENSTLRLLSLNAENLFLLFDEPVDPSGRLEESHWQKLSTSIYENKPLKKCTELARCIKDVHPQIIMLCEVGGLESLKNFNDMFLNQAYSVALVEGNSDRNIDVGFLVEKNLPFYFDIQTNKNRSLNFVYPHERSNPHATVQKFSRDAVELRLFKRDREKPFFIILQTHLKSRLDPDGIDANGFERRRAEVTTLLQIFKELQEKYPTVPIVVSGDFNGFAGRPATEEEFKSIYQQTDLIDVLEVDQVKPDQRYTYYQIKTGMRSEGRQIDYCFLNDLARKKLAMGKSTVFRFKDENGMELDRPQTMEAKTRLPSDHYPIVFELENLIIK